MGRTAKKVLMRVRRKKRVRRKISGTAVRPRMSVFRSARHIYVQVVDDITGRTVAAASTLTPELKGELAGVSKLEAAKKVGALAAKRCLDANVKEVVFDRNGYIYTGRVAAIADAARETGLKV
jgi:large subunit ribosomal protein L18